MQIRRKISGVESEKFEGEKIQRKTPNQNETASSEKESRDGSEVLDAEIEEENKDEEMFRKRRTQ